jgi:hypothetical protein
LDPGLPGSFFAIEACGRRDLYVCAGSGRVLNHDYRPHTDGNIETCTFAPSSTPRIRVRRVPGVHGREPWPAGATDPIFSASVVVRTMVSTRFFMRR